MKFLPLLLSTTLVSGFALAVTQDGQQRPERTAPPQTQRLVKFSEVNSSAVKNREIQDGEVETDKVADMADVVLDEKGDAAFVILSRGRLGDIGDTLIMVPKKSVEVSWEAAEADEVPDCNLHTDLTEQKLSDAPELDEDAWGESGEAACSATERYFGIERKGKSTIDASAPKDGQKPTDERTKGATQNGNPMIRLTEVMGADIQGADGETIASVENVILDPKTWNVAFVVVAYGSILGLGEDLRALPMSAFQTERNDDFELVCKTNLTKAQLEAAPVADPDRWDEQGTLDFAKRVKGAFGKDESKMKR